MNRRLLASLLACALCGAAGSRLREGEMLCSSCLPPTRLRLWKDTLGLEAAEMAALAGVSRSTVTRALRGDPLRIDQAERLALLTRIDVIELLAGTTTGRSRHAAR